MFLVFLSTMFPSSTSLFPTNLIGGIGVGLRQGELTHMMYI